MGCTSDHRPKLKLAPKQWYARLKEKEIMTRLVLIASISMVILGPVPKVQAQVTIDVAKITCDQYTSFKITDPEHIAIWLSGFYNGKRDKTVVDTQGLKEEAKKVWDYCIRNPKIPVMNAVETVLKPDSK
jgi:hypothetical protein